MKAITCSADKCAQCFYCDAALSPRHEHDHMPIPIRHGGEDYVTTCLNCHDLKDRIPLRGWSPEMVARAFKEMSPLGRILTAKLYALTLDVQRARDEQASA